MGGAGALPACQNSCVVSGAPGANGASAGAPGQGVLRASTACSSAIAWPIERAGGIAKQRAPVAGQRRARRPSRRSFNRKRYRREHGRLAVQDVEAEHRRVRHRLLAIVDIEDAKEPPYPAGLALC